MATEEENVAPANLCRLLLNQLEEVYWSTGRSAPRQEAFEAPVEELIAAEYRPKSFLRRRAPDEIETALTQLDQGALNMVKQSFKNNLDLADFAKAIVSTGTYDADRVLAFVSGVVDLYLEIVRSQADSNEKAVRWAQLMNHFIESPEIVMFEGSEVASAVGPKSASSTSMAQVRRSNLVDCAKHMGASIRKISWMPSLEMLATVEGTESVYFWSPSMAWETARVVTPQLPADYFDEQKPLWTVHAVAWDEAQDLVALLSNRFLIFWRLRNREKGQFQQKKEFRFHATRQEGKPGTFPWKVYLRSVDPKNGEEASEEEVVRAKVQKEVPEILLGEKSKVKVRPADPQVTARKEKREQRLAAEAAQQLDIWWNASMKVWVSADYEGRLYLWDLREHTIESTIYPMKVLQSHSQVVTSFLELSSFKFTTCSLDRSVCLWDTRNFSAPEVKLEEHTGAVLSQAYLPLFSSLVTVGCEKRVFVWSIDSTAYRGVRAKLSAHQANLAQVSTGHRIFVTLDEACIFILWDGATLQALQTTNCSTLAPKHVVVLPSLGRVVLASRRLNFFDGNEQGAIALGAAPSKEQLALAKRREEGASLKDRAAPRWCGLAPSRGVLLSATEAEVRLHGRICPSQSKVIFQAPEGDSISAFAACDSQSFSVLGTAKGAVYFLKYRSGFTLREYHGRREDLDEWSGGGAQQVEAIEATGERSPPASRSAKRGPDGGGFEPRAAGLQTSPSVEDFQRGLSSCITCVLPEEEQKRVYVGTVEGRVIIFSTEHDFSVVRWIHLEDGGAVTALDVAVWAEGVEVPDGELPGLLAVGTQDGMVHIYSLANGRLAGTINIPKALPEGDSHALRHVRMVKIAAEPSLPVTLMTIDRCSRIRFWGFKVHVQSGKLEGLKLLVDAGQLRECDCIPAEWLSRLKEKRDTEARIRKKKREEEAAKAAKAKAAKEAEQNPNAANQKGEAVAEEEQKPEAEDEGSGEGENLAAEARWTSKEPIRICGFTAMPSTPVQLPIDCLDKQPFEGPVASASAAVEEMKNSPAYKAAQAKLKQAQENSSTFLTQTSTSGVTAARYLDLEKEEEAVEEFSGSDTDGDADEIVAKRFAEMPRLPSSAPNALMLGDSAAAEALRAAKEAVQADIGGVGHGDSLVFIADTGGWLWCLDIAQTISTALSSTAPLAVALDERMAAQVREELAKDRGEKRSKRPRGTAPVATLENTRPSISPSSPTGVSSGTSEGSQIGMLIGLPPKARPEVIQVLGAWPAHLPPIATLVVAGRPPALVTVDMTKEVKVWSTSGDIWGHFSLRSGKATAVWPPPHVLACQMSLIRIAKGLCRRMGFHISKQEKMAAQRATPKGRAQRGLTAAERREQIAARRREKQRQVAQKHAAKAREAEAAEAEDEGEEKVEAGGAAKEEVVAPTLGESDAERAKAEVPAAPTSPTSVSSPVPASGSAPQGTAPRRRFTAQQMKEMIRGNAFSSGCQSYKQFASRPKAQDGTERGVPRSTKVQDLEAQRQHFFGRSPQVFGVELATKSEKEAWQHTVKTMPRRAESEGALLRYASSRVEEMTGQVKKSLGVDVTTTTRRRMRKSSFLSDLDIGHVSQDPTNPASATGQAVRKLMKSRSAGLLNAGNQVMSGSNRGTHMS